MEQEVNFQVLRQRFDDHVREHDTALGTVKQAFDNHEREHKKDTQWRVGLALGIVVSILSTVFTYVSGYGELKTSVGHIDAELKNKADRAELTAAVENFSDKVEVIRLDIRDLKDSVKQR